MSLIDPANTDTTVDQVANLAVGISQPQYVGDYQHDGLDGGSALAAVYVVPEGYDVHTVDLQEIRNRYAAAPRRKTGTVRAATVDALITYHAKHATDAAEVWVGADGTIVDVLNAHTVAMPEWGDHRVVLRLVHSSEWLRWTRVSGNLQRQEEFAEFLVAAAANVVTPDMATMLEVAQSLTANSKVEFESSYRTTDGQRGFKYKETTNAKAGQRGELEIPETMLLSLRVFAGQQPQPVAARFRYRLDGDALRLGVVIDRLDEIVEQALAAVAAEIAERIDGRGLVLAGSPE